MRRGVLVASLCFLAGGSGYAGMACSTSPAGSLHDAGTAADAPAHDAGDAGSGGPQLVALGVGGSTPGVLLTPPFDPTIHDYYLSCARGKNPVMLSMTASEGATSRLKRPSSTPPSVSQTVSITLDEDEAVVAEATDGASTTEYWVRCLPHDFPALVFTPHPEVGARTPGYYLVANVFVGPRSSGYAIILDTNGVPVWYRSTGSNTGAANLDSLEPGQVSFVPYTLVAPYEVLDLASGLTVQIAPEGYTPDVHELRKLANGNYMTFAYAFKYGMDLTGLSYETEDGGVAPGPDSIIQDCALLELSGDGDVVWRWVASDHFDPVKDTTAAMHGYGTTPPDGGVAFDVFHCNSIDVDPASGNVLVSARQMDSIFYIERKTGKVLWKLGGREASVDGATYVKPTDPFVKQHDARLLPGWSNDCRGGAGRISVFDDESSLGSPARALVYDVVVGGSTGSAGCSGEPPSGKPGVAEKVWQYVGTGNAATDSGGMGSFRISADGSRVIGWGLVPLMGFTEVDEDGHDLLDFTFANDTTYRALKLPTSAFDLGLLRRTAGEK